MGVKYIQLCTVSVNFDKTGSDVISDIGQLVAALQRGLQAPKMFTTSSCLVNSCTVGLIS